MIRVAINGFGRIGRLIFRIMEDDSSFEVVAINDLTDAEQLAYLLKYDTSHGNYRTDDISFDEDNIIVGNRKIRVYSETDPANLPWGQLNIDEVFECTGHFTDKDKAYAHITAGAKKVIISAPSCTTNCLAPVLNIIEKNIGIEKGFMTTVHAYTNDQATLDIAHKKGINARRGRACASNIVPSSTGAASAIGLVIPSLKGKMDGGALRVPVTTGSVIDLTLELKRNTTPDEINKLFIDNSNETIKLTMDPIVSSDIKGSYLGSLVDGQLTKVVEVDGKQLVKIIAWYDNEMGYSAQMVRTAKYFGKI